MVVKALKLGGVIQGAKYVVHAPNTVPFLVELRHEDLIPGTDALPLLRSKIASMLYLIDGDKVEVEFVLGLF